MSVCSNIIYTKSTLITHKSIKYNTFTTPNIKPQTLILLRNPNLSPNHNTNPNLKPQTLILDPSPMTNHNP